MGEMAFRKLRAASSDEQLSERTGCFDDGDINWGGGEGGGGGGNGEGGFACRSKIEEGGLEGEDPAGLPSTGELLGGANIPARSPPLPRDDRSAPLSLLDLASPL